LCGSGEVGKEKRNNWFLALMISRIMKEIKLSSGRVVTIVFNRF